MKPRIFIIFIIAASFAALTSCASSRGGCKSNQGYVGYGSAR